MPWSALPDHLNPRKNPEAWKGTDTFWKRWTRGLLSFGPRATEKWAKWRDCPLSVFAWRGKGLWRVEEKTGKERIGMDENTVHSRPDGYFISRIQPFCRFHVALQWPLFVSWHIFWRQKDVEAFDAHKYAKRTIKSLLCGYIGAKFDPVDQFYSVSFSIGGSWE